MSKQNNMRRLNWRQCGWRSVGWKNSDVTVEAPDGAILYFDATKNKPLLPVTYNGKYLVVKNV